jgi:hypothetical protein
MLASPELLGMIGLTLLGLGFLGQVIGGIWLVVLGFRKSVLWGLGVWFVPFVNIIFAAMHWSEAQIAVVLSLLGLVFTVLGVYYLESLSTIAPGL